MLRFEEISVEEKLYPFVKATAKAEYPNGVLGTVGADGVFTAGTGFMSLMQIEKGDDMHTDKFTVKKDEPCRVADLKVAVGKVVDITNNLLPSTVAVGNMLTAKTDGTLKVDASATTGLKVIEVCNFGVRAIIVVA